MGKYVKFLVYSIFKVRNIGLGPFDAAVARITGERPILDTTLEGDKIDDVMVPRLGMMVWKSGRTTGRTEGFIDGVMMSTQINYGAAGVRRLEQVVRIIPRPGSPPGEVSMGGDSGSVWVDEASGKAIGLHFAGEIGNAPEYGLANDINAVIGHLSLLFPAQRPSAPPPADPEPPVDEPDPTPTPSPIDPRPIMPPPPSKTLSVWERLLQWLRSLFG